VIGEGPVDETHDAGADAQRMGGFARGPDPILVAGERKEDVFMPVNSQSEP